MSASSCSTRSFCSSVNSGAAMMRILPLAHSALCFRADAFWIVRLVRHQPVEVDRVADAVRPRRMQAALVDAGGEFAMLRQPIAAVLKDGHLAGTAHHVAVGDVAAAHAPVSIAPRQRPDDLLLAHVGHPSTRL